MGFDLIGRNIDESHTGDSKVIIPVSNSLFQLIGGLKSSMGYCGAKNLSSFHKNSHFIEISSAGVKESHPHEVSIVKEAPNYQGHDK